MSNSESNENESKPVMPEGPAGAPGAEQRAGSAGAADTPVATPANADAPIDNYDVEVPPAKPVVATKPTVTKRPVKAAPAHGPVKRVKAAPAGSSSDRRDFFSDAMRETLAPFTGIIQRKINPLLAALEAIPVEAERLAQQRLPKILDQPQTRAVALPVEPEAPRATDRYLRPPGAMAPGEFEQVCTNCNKCVEACPAHAIKIDPRGVMGGGLPYIIPSEQPCVVCTDLACMPACPTGALKMVGRLKIKIGTAKVDVHQCLRDHGEDCRLCVEACPITGAGAEGGPDAIFIHGQTGRVRVRKNVCVGCGLCESRCPTSPAAIMVWPYVPPHDPIVA